MSVGKNERHDSSSAHVTGRSTFIDDREDTVTEVYVGLAYAPIARGTIDKIDYSGALLHPDCLGIYVASDIKAKSWGAIVHDQQFLASTQVNHMSEPVCIIASSTRESIPDIQELIKIHTTEKQGVFSIDEAKAINDTLYKATPFKRGDVETVLKESDHNLTGAFICGGQEHFYLESQAAVVYPKEKGHVEVHSSSQHPSETQRVVAEALGLPFHKVVCIVKRMGGGFGGKESQAAPIAAYAGIVAQDLGRPARIILTKDDDMKITGKRHPFQNEYTVGFNSDGKITALKVHIQSDGGAYSDLSSSILERAMFHIDGAYYLENVDISGTCYRTNNHSNTAYRGFGGPQGNMTIESIIEDIAVQLGKSSFEIRKINRYEADNIVTPYGQTVENNMLPMLFDNLYKKSDYENRLKEIIEFNKEDNGVIRGISMTATKFGIAFTAKFLNQGNALVNLHLDGTIQASTGATEMGQGVNTKIAQICAHAFGISIDDVEVMSTSTEKNHNTSPTAASSGSDINGSAALSACNKIKKKLRGLAKLKFDEFNFDDSLLEDFVLPKVEANEIVFKAGKVIEVATKKEMLFKDLITLAYFNRISLGGYAHYKTPGLGFHKGRGVGKPFNYFTQGTVVSEVSVDEFTGEVKVLDSNILMDLGRPLNPGIDKGQVTGAFVQAMGWVTTESLYYDDKRNLISHSPTTYKIPNIQDTPRKFEVELIENNDNDCNVHKSKAVGEPPFVLGISVWTAIKHALSFRGNGIVNLKSPATNEEILMELTRRVQG